MISSYLLRPLRTEAQAIHEQEQRSMADYLIRMDKKLTTGKWVEVYDGRFPTVNHTVAFVKKADAEIQREGNVKMLRIIIVIDRSK